MSAIPGLRSALECRNLISSNSFAHRLGTGNSALRLAPGPVGLKPELRQGRSRPLTGPKKKKSKYVALDFSADFLFFIFYFVSSFFLI
jgi:hypothetical protein